MSDRGDSFDPIEAARHDLERSREALASVAGELDAHRRWFKSYLAEEEKKRKEHARRLKRHEAAAAVPRKTRARDAIREAGSSRHFAGCAFGVPLGLECRHCDANHQPRLAFRRGRMDGEHGARRLVVRLSAH